MAKKIKFPRNHIIFFDFDNTITTGDVLDDMILKFSKDNRWKDLEKKWARGEIGSKECLKGQIDGIRIPKDALDTYLSRIKLDGYFKKLLQFFASKKIKVIILSDNFDYILKRVLKSHNIPDIEIYSNKLKIVKDRLIPSFPFTNRDCVKCAHCKKRNMLPGMVPGKVAVYIGDGLSDVCASKYADIVFAKSYLAKWFRDQRMVHIPFRTLKDVYKHLQRSLA